MKIENFVVPITTTDGKLLGLELESRVEINGCRMIIGRGREADNIRQLVHSQQVREIEKKADWFRKNKLFCVLTTETSNRTELPFVKYFTTENNVPGQVWLDDVGAFTSSTMPLIAGVCEVARLERRFTDEHIDRAIFPVILKNLHQYCDQIIVPVTDKNYHQMLREAGVWAVQGEYKPIRFEHCEKLL